MDIAPINHLSLCAGYGGIDLGLSRVLPNVRTIAYVEIEAFAVANLVEKVEKGWLDEAPVWTNLKTFDAKPFCGMVGILSGGFPCQPFSHAGNRESTDDPRHLFPDVERIIGECRPSIVFLENVEGIISAKLHGEPDTSVLKHVLERLEDLGYKATAGIFSAEEVGAPHRRKRVFICGISNDDCERFVRKQKSHGEEGSLEEQRWNDPDRCGSISQQGNLANAGHDASTSCGEGNRAGELDSSTEGKGRSGDTETISSKRRSELVANPKCVSAGRDGSEIQGQTTEVGREISQPSSTEHSSGDGSPEYVVGNTTSDGLNARQPDKEAGRTERCCQAGRVSESEGRCCQLGNTEHDGSPEQERGSTSQTSEGSEKGSHATLQSEGTDRSQVERDLSGRTVVNPDSERLEGNTGDIAGEEECFGTSEGYERCATLGSLFPNRPNQSQQWWEYPRTIGEAEETQSPLGVPTDAGFRVPADLVNATRVDSLRLGGNGVVPATAAKAFMYLMDELTR